MIVGSWIMSTVISIPPLFGLKDPADNSIDSFQPVNRSRGELFPLQPTSGDSTAEDDTSLFEYRDFGEMEDVEFSYSDRSYAMSSDDVSPLRVDAALNETLSFELEETEVNCIISQNLGYDNFLLV